MTAIVFETIMTTEYDGNRFETIMLKEYDGNRF